MVITSRVLLLQDQRALRCTLERALRINGYDVMAVDSGYDFKNRIALDRVDILMADVLLAGRIDGIELAQAARTLWPRLPIVLMSGVGRPNPPAGILTDPDVRLLGKPFTVASLLQALSELLSPKQSGLACRGKAAFVTQPTISVPAKK
jgi:DNA-binding NtrC family response regulator